jgi:hypothetical protein
MLDVPIFHVNGNDPIAAVHCIEMALDFRQQFSRDVVVELSASENMATMKVTNQVSLNLNSMQPLQINHS